MLFSPLYDVSRPPRTQSPPPFSTEKIAVSIPRGEGGRNWWRGNATRKESRVSLYFQYVCAAQRFMILRQGRPKTPADIVAKKKNSVYSTVFYSFLVTDCCHGCLKGLNLAGDRRFTRDCTRTQSVGIFLYIYMAFHIRR